MSQSHIEEHGSVGKDSPRTNQYPSRSDTTTTTTTTTSTTTSTTTTTTTTATMKGPKEIVAESLAHALADFFVIDPTTVQTNLLHNAGITLNEVSLKERIINIHETTCATIHGGVQRVTFSWSWGGDGKGSDWVKDAKLDIIGLSLEVTLSNIISLEEIKQDEINHSTPEQEFENIEVKKGISAYIEYVFVCLLAPRVTVKYDCHGQITKI